MDVRAAQAGTGVDLKSALQAVSAQPLWDRYQRITRRQPDAAVAPGHWSWAAMSPYIERAVNEVSMEDAERRVLLLTPTSAAATTGNLIAGLQILQPGEHARAHRHTIAALRWVLQGQGAVTHVNDVACAMARGDLILTPSWTWHAHDNPGDERVVWLDGLDLPLCAHLDTMFFEFRSPASGVTEPAPTSPGRKQVDMAVLEPDPGCRFRYSGERALQALKAAAPQHDGSRWLRYVDPVSGGAVLPTMDCYLLGLMAGASTAPRRSTASVVCAVLKGSGRTCIGEQTLDWQQNDVFTLPHWQWASHSAASEGAVLACVTDRDLLHHLGYFREEVNA